MSAITPQGQLYFEMLQHSYKSADVIAFVEKVHRRVGQPLLLIWDNAPIHRSRSIRKYLEQGAAKYLQIEALPPDAPDLNPDEGVWGYLKRVLLKNESCANVSELKQELKRASTKLRYKRQVLKGCVAQAGLVV